MPTVETSQKTTTTTTKSSTPKKNAPSKELCQIDLFNFVLQLHCSKFDLHKAYIVHKYCFVKMIACFKLVAHVLSESGPLPRLQPNEHRGADLKSAFLYKQE